MALLPACLSLLDLIIPVLEFGIGLSRSEHFLNEGTLPLLASQARTKELRGTLDQRPYLRELRKWVLAGIFFEMTLRIQDSTHTQELKVSLHIGIGQVRSREVIPIRASIICSSLVTVSGSVISDGDTSEKE